MSVVMVSRNDDHGGNPLERTQLCINSLYEQCNRFRLPVELIIVDWNPPLDRPGLADVIHWPEDRQYIRARVITVPLSFHRALPHSDSLLLFQMIGKNVGIRRACGEYVLATNIDILFSDDLIEYISRRSLQHGHSYRADRLDVNNNILNEPLGNVMPYCNNHVIRVNIKPGTFFNATLGKIGKFTDPFFNSVLWCMDSHATRTVSSFFLRVAQGVQSTASQWSSAIIIGITYGKAIFHPLVLKIQLFQYNLRIDYYQMTDTGKTILKQTVLKLQKIIFWSASQLKKGLKRVISIIRGILYRITNIIIPKRYKTPLRNTGSGLIRELSFFLKRTGSVFKNIFYVLHKGLRGISASLTSAIGRSWAFIVSIHSAFRRVFSKSIEAILFAAKKIKIAICTFAGWFKIRSPVTGRKKNSIVMLIELYAYRFKVRSDFGFPYIHLNGCGDFTLMAKEDWDALGGYLEDPIFSWNVDSLLLIDAYYRGLPEVYLMPPKNSYHVEHSAGSGWTPGKGEQLLFERLEKSKIPYISWADCLAYATRWRETTDKKELLRKIKRMDYGFPEWELPEKCIELSLTTNL